MAKATAWCTCKKCGATFPMVSIVRSLQEADAWMETAGNACDTCPDCYRAANDAEVDARNAARFALPEITGVSDKQIACAASLRRFYVFLRRGEMEYGQRIIDSTEEEILGWYAACGKPFPGDFARAKIEIIADAYPTTAKIFATADAGKIIDLLK